MSSSQTAESQPSAGQPAELSPVTYDFENMSLGMVQVLHRLLFDADETEVADPLDSLDVRRADLDSVKDSFYQDLANLPWRNLGKARELIIPLARSEHIADRYAAACDALAQLIRRECEVGTEDVAEQVGLIIALLNEEPTSRPASLVSGEAGSSADTALAEGWWREDVVAEVKHAWWGWPKGRAGQPQVPTEAISPPSDNR